MTDVTQELPLQGVKVVDFNPVEAHRLAGVPKYRWDALKTPLIRMKQDQAKVWEALTGKRPGVADINHAPNAGGYLFPSGLKRRDTPEAIRRTLHGLGRGSRQAKKARGAKRDVQALNPELQQRLQQAVASRPVQVQAPPTFVPIVPVGMPAQRAVQLAG